MNNATTAPRPPAPRYWKAVVGLAIVYVSITMQWPWAWGIVLAWWVGIDLKSGETWFMQTVGRSEAAPLYWLILLTWSAIAAYLIATIWMTAT